MDLTDHWEGLVYIESLVTAGLRWYMFPATRSFNGRIRGIASCKAFCGVELQPIMTYFLRAEARIIPACPGYHRFSFAISDCKLPALNPYLYYNYD